MQDVTAGEMQQQEAFTDALRPQRTRSTWRRFKRQRSALAGALIIVLLVAAAALGPVISPYNALHIDVDLRFSPPGTSHYLFGGDELGRDLLTRLLMAGRISLTVGLVSMLLSITVGTALGALAGYYGGVVETIIMRIVDAILCFPSIYLLLGLAAFVKPSLLTITVIIAMTAWMEVARIVFGQIRALREREFVVATQAAGARSWYIIRRHLLPNAAAPIIVAATLNVANAILLESYISFLGYGIQPPTASWGNMLNNAQAYFVKAPWIAIFPGVLITLAVIGCNLLGDGLRHALDPRSESL